MRELLIGYLMGVAGGFVGGVGLAMWILSREADDDED